MRFLVYGRRGAGFTLTARVDFAPLVAPLRVRTELSLAGLLELREHSELRRDKKSGQPCLVFEGHEFVLTATARHKLDELGTDYVYEGWDK